MSSNETGESNNKPLLPWAGAFTPLEGPAPLLGVPEHGSDDLMEDPSHLSPAGERALRVRCLAAAQVLTQFYKRTFVRSSDGHWVDYQSGKTWEQISEDLIDEAAGAVKGDAESPTLMALLNERSDAQAVYNDTLAQFWTNPMPGEYRADSTGEQNS